MPKLALLPVGLFVVWCFVCQRWYVCYIKKQCGTEQNEQPPPAPTIDNRPLVFNWSDAGPVTRPNFDAYRDSILKALPEGKLLEMVGLYFKAEKTPKDFSNMGLARATNLKEFFGKNLPAEQLVVTSRLVEETEGVREKPFVGAEFNIKDVPKGDEVEIIEVENQISILFPYAKATKEPEPRVDEYLAKLAERLKQTDETVTITGHTDDAGTVEFNQKLGLERAKHVRDILVSKGIDAGRLQIDSKGETEPVASNDTEEGSRQNRRAVLVLNKKQ